MSEGATPTSTDQASFGGERQGVFPAAVVAPARRWWSWAWVVPVLAIAAAMVLFYQAGRERGPVIEVRFRDGLGVKVGDALQFRGVQVGQVREVSLAHDLSAVVVSIELQRGAEGIAREGSRFWIVRPEVSVTRVSGLETLLGPRYVAVEPGEIAAGGDGEASLRRVFEGLERAPLDAGPTDGLVIVVRASHRGSIVVGSPVTYRGVRVGGVRDVSMAADGRFVEIQAVVEPMYAHFVRSNSRFWDAGGIGVDFGLVSGLTMQARSLETVLLGGIAFATPTRAGERVQRGHTFNLESKPDSSWLDWQPDLSPQHAGR